LINTNNNSLIPINAIPFAVIHINTSGVISACNDRAEQVSGYCTTELEGQLIEIFIPDFTRPTIDQNLTGSTSGAHRVSLLCKSEHVLNCIINVTEIENGFMVFITEVDKVDIPFNQMADSVGNSSSLLAKKLMNSIKEAFWEWNIEEGTIYYSAQVMEVFGHKAEAFTGSTSFWENQVDSKDLESFHSEVISHFKGELSCIHPTLPFTTEEGITKWFSIFGKIIEFKNGRAYKMFGTVKDVTEHHQLVDKLKERNSYLSLAESLNQSGHWRIDFIENTLYWSTEVYNIHGVDPINYKPCLDSAISFYVEDEKDRVKGFIDASIEHQQGFRYKSVIRNKLGNKVKVECLGEVEINSKGEVVGIFGVFKDITKSEDVFEKLKLMAMVNYTIKVPVFFIDDKDNIVYQDLTPKASNCSSVLFDYINFSISDYLAFKRKAKECGQFKKTSISFDKYNTVYDLSVTYEAEEGIYIWIVENVTDKFRKDQQQIISNRLALLGNTFGNVSHDINNVLGVALGATEMLEIKVSQGEKDISKYIDRVKNAIDKGKSVTERLLAFTRKPVIKVVKFDPIQDIIDNQYLFKQLLLSTIDFKLNIKNVHCEIKFPQGEFINILLNLVLNSQDAIREQGLIGEIEISANINEDQHLEIHIKDSGRGIEQENLTKVFDPFYSSKSINKGNGIGLANVYSTIYKHNGHIQLEGYGSLGGAHFTLVFKCNVLTSKPVVTSTETKSQLKMKGKHVLILDDEISIAEFVALYLETEGVIAEHVNNKDDLIKVLASEQVFDVFITDMILPDITGREAVQLVQEKFPNIRIYSISGYIAEEDKKWEYPLLRKPFNSKDLTNFLIENNK
jgi:signal transduction histidine kinase/PAS domain-containing protein